MWVDFITFVVWAFNSLVKGEITLVEDLSERIYNYVFSLYHSTFVTFHKIRSILIIYLSWMFACGYI